MADHEDSTIPCYLISIEASNLDALFESYRDYLVFMSLVRDGVRGYQYKALGFCWLSNRCLLLIRPETPTIGSFLLRLLKRYHYWLIQRGSAMTEFKLQLLKLEQSSWILDSLRFLHQQAVQSKVVTDAMDYHWHSHHIYNGFWSLNWLDTDFILNKFAGNRLVAMNRFRQYMQHPHRLDFQTLLERLDCSSDYLSGGNSHGPFHCNRAIAEINSQYHQSMLDRTQVSYIRRNASQYVRVTVVDEMMPQDRLSQCEKSLH